MKKCLSICLAFAIMLSVSLTSSALAYETGTDYIDNNSLSEINQMMLKNDSTYQNFVATYGPVTVDTETTSFVVTETDQSNNSNSKTASTITNIYSEEEFYKRYSVGSDTYNIGPGEPIENTDSVLRITLTVFTTTNSNRFLISGRFNWIKLPSDFRLRMKGIIGIAMEQNMTIDGSSYSGTVYRVYSGGADSLQMDLQPTDISGISGSYTTAFSGYQSLNGILTCIGNKAGNYVGCPIFLSYADVSFKLTFNPISVSAGGISINGGEIPEQYTVQDTFIFP